MTYEDDKDAARSASVGILAAAWDQRTFFVGIDAYILSYKVWNMTLQRYDAYCEWIGGETAAISHELMAELMPDADIGDKVKVDQLSLVIVEYSDVAGFWYVRQAE